MSSYLLDQHQKGKREEEKRDVKSGKRGPHFNAQKKKKTETSKYFSGLIQRIRPGYGQGWKERN
jgi:hypothetical protein